MFIQSLSKRAASKYKPEKPTLLISIQDGALQELPFKQRTNHITRNRYVDCLFLYFDDINPNAIPGKPTMPFAFSDYDADVIIDFLERHFSNNDFEDIIVHCQAGVSRSHAVALFIAKFFAKDEGEYQRLLHQEWKVYGGNAYVYDKLIERFMEKSNTRLLVNVGYEYAFIPTDKLQGISLKEAGKIIVDEVERAVSKAETFAESQKLDGLFDSKDVKPFRIQ